jgi:hypothetical protein
MVEQSNRGKGIIRYSIQIWQRKKYKTGIWTWTWCKVILSVNPNELEDKAVREIA